MLNKIIISHKLNIPLEEVDQIVEGLVKRGYMYFNEKEGYRLTEQGKLWKQKYEDVK